MKGLEVDALSDSIKVGRWGLAWLLMSLTWTVSILRHELLKGPKFQEQELSGTLAGMETMISNASRVSAITEGLSTYFTCLVCSARATGGPKSTVCCRTAHMAGLAGGHGSEYHTSNELTALTWFVFHGGGTQAESLGTKALSSSNVADSSKLEYEFRDTKVL